MKSPAGFISTAVAAYQKRRLTVNYTISRVLTVLLRTVFLIGMSFVMLYPVIFMLSSGFKSLQDIYDPTVVWLPQHFSLEPMEIALEVLDYVSAVGKTLKMTIPSVLLQLITVLLAGYGFARFRFRGKKLLFGLLIFTIIVPVQSYIIPLYVNFKSLGLLNKDLLFYVQALFGMGIRSGLYIFMLRQFFRNMPLELEEAAMIDGCGPMRTFTRIMLPNAGPMIATVLVFSLVWYWNDYYLSSMFYNGSFPISVNLTSLSSLLKNSNMVSGIAEQELMFMRESILACGCLVTILPLLVLYIFAQRFFTEGLERSGIVG